MELVPLRPLLRPRPRPRLRLEEAEELGAEEGVLGVGKTGAEDEDRSGLVGGLGVLCEVTEGLG